MVAAAVGVVLLSEPDKFFPSGDAVPFLVYASVTAVIIGAVVGFTVLYWYRRVYRSPAEPAPQADTTETASQEVTLIE